MCLLFCIRCCIGCCCKKKKESFKRKVMAIAISFLSVWDFLTDLLSIGILNRIDDTTVAVGNKYIPIFALLLVLLYSTCKQAIFLWKVSHNIIYSLLSFIGLGVVSNTISKWNKFDTEDKYLEWFDLYWIEVSSELLPSACLKWMLAILMFRRDKLPLMSIVYIITIITIVNFGRGVARYWAKRNIFLEPMKSHKGFLNYVVLFVGTDIVMRSVFKMAIIGALLRNRGTMGDTDNGVMAFYWTLTVFIHQIWMECNYRKYFLNWDVNKQTNNCCLECCIGCFCCCCSPSVLTTVDTIHLSSLSNYIVLCNTFPLYVFVIILMMGLVLAEDPDWQLVFFTSYILVLPTILNFIGLIGMYKNKGGNISSMDIKKEYLQYAIDHKYYKNKTETNKEHEHDKTENNLSNVTNGIELKVNEAINISNNQKQNPVTTYAKPPASQQLPVRTVCGYQIPISNNVVYVNQYGQPIPSPVNIQVYSIVPQTNQHTK